MREGPVQNGKGTVASAWAAAFLMFSVVQSGQSSTPPVIGEVTGYVGGQIRTFTVDGQPTGERMSTANLPRGRVLVRAPNNGPFGIVTPTGVIYVRGIDVSYRLDNRGVCEPISSNGSSRGAIAATAAGAGTVHDCRVQP